MRITYRPDIDGLRALAVLAVLGFHAFPEVVHGGFVGVDVFFVISGFLITSIVAVEVQDQSWSLRSFYARRILRIFPALLLVLTTTIWLGWYVLLADEYKPLGKHAAAGAGFVANFAYWFEAGYFDRASELKPLLHLWSLGIEEQFYIVWPVALWLLFRTRRTLDRYAAGLLGLSLVYACVLVWFDRTQAFYSPLARAWELLAGAWLALRQMRDAKLPSWLLSRGAQWGALLTLLVCIFSLRPEFTFPGAWAAVPVLASVVLIGAGGAAGTSVQKVLSTRALVWIGLVSYPLYLWHWPLLSYARIIENGTPSVAMRFSLLGLAVVLAFLTYRLVERPLRKLPRRRVIGALVVLMMLVGLVGSNIYVRDGLERIRHKRIIHLDEVAAADFVDFEKIGLITEEKCDQPFKFPARDVCLIASPSQPVTAVVVGDSHAVHAFWGLAEALKATGDNLKVLGKGACVPFLHYTQGNDAIHCQPHIDQTLESIAKNSAVRKVVLIFRGRYLPANAAPADILALEQSLDATLHLLTTSGKQVYYFLPVVEPGFDPRLCAGALPLGRKPPRACVIDHASSDQKSSAIRDVAHRITAKYPRVFTLDPNLILCPDVACSLVREGHSIFKDDNHLSYFGSMLMGRYLNLSQIPPEFRARQD